MEKKSKSILWSSVAAGAMLGAASIFASCSTESKDVTTEVQTPAKDTTGEHTCGTEHTCGKDSAEAKCGEGKAADAKCGEHKTTEGKCGEGKCGADKKK
ncbi:HvfA family oxazolone/thioamide-modified RiPP metallophore [Cytophaga hutchinsonii]|uniref:Lipoprotein n=1 Tax=Cytophaga hutchinsonii (strain ATCC 33406 / DSM 1761 / CIP 103989 / NBRC 15051 / NCIMB 9469 / D465) TaxID=269798 RepID=A0A6N4SV35_CYTH3|nr:hypothetical protein [Cytophaga hutchinsonii]ABG60335.1 conserved hypothetical protein [Cytophaga hutchinsonii ATCC 33406]SFX98795.1 hypothetical protein SAMN04487930_1179 [Cytophaga hutchinsonii ATCC 33406]